VDPRFDEAVLGVRSGDPRAFRTLAEILGPALVRYLTILLRGDTHAAHDVAQEVLLRAWDAREDFESGPHLRRWVYRVAHCKAITWMRRRSPPGRRTLSLDAAGGDWQAGPATPESHDLVGALRRALRTLPANYVGAIHLHYLQGFTTGETARLLGLSRESVKMRLHRARRHLRDEIAREVATRRTEGRRREGETGGGAHAEEGRPDP
jgi:RNA polymerase sigma-70 factor (ECF subfamily)